MGKLQMCRMCLAENVRMYVVVDKTLHFTYEKLTNNPFVTEDSRPILACYICCAQLKKCYRFQKKCWEAEEMFSRIIYEEYERKPLINQDQIELFHGFIKTPTQNINIVDVVQTESVFVKEEKPAVVEEKPDEIPETKVEHHDDDQEMVNPYNYLELELPSDQTESKSETYVPSVEVKIELEEEPEVTETTPTPEELNWPPVPQMSKLEEAIRSGKPKKELSDTKVFPNFQPSTTNNTERLNNSDHWEIPHIKGRDPSRPFFCHLCQRGFSIKYNLLKHNCKRPGDKPFKCNLCDSTFTQKGGLQKHIRIHTGEKPFKCDICEMSFREKGHLSQHNKRHTGEKPFKCELCGYSSSRKEHLNQHIRRHTGEKPFKCETCESCFTDKGDYVKHQRIHTGEKPFTCEVCHFSFSRKVHLNQHMRKHTGEKPFKCDTCESCFSKKGDLKNHILIHTGEKPFKCEVCQRCFRQKSILKKHSKVHVRENYSVNSFGVMGDNTQHISAAQTEETYSAIQVTRSPSTDVVTVKSEPLSDNNHTFEVTVEHTH